MEKDTADVAVPVQKDTADVAVPVEEDTVDAASPVEKHNLEDIPEDTVPVVVSIQVRSS